MKEPVLMRCAVREGDDEWHIECRFSDGQKYAAIKLDGACPQLATRVAALLNGNIWTDERPTEPGEYWVSVRPGKRGFNSDPSKPTRPNRSVIPVVIEIDSVSFEPGLTVYFDRRGFGTNERSGWVGKLDSGFFDGAKWSRRETPADPFEVTA
jgi:hypothetical protein